MQHDVSNVADQASNAHCIWHGPVHFLISSSNLYSVVNPAVHPVSIGSLLYYYV